MSEVSGEAIVSMALALGMLLRVEKGWVREVVYRGGCERVSIPSRVGEVREGQQEEEEGEEGGRGVVCQS